MPLHSAFVHSPALSHLLHSHCIVEFFSAFSTHTHSAQHLSYIVMHGTATLLHLHTLFTAAIAKAVGRLPFSAPLHLYFHYYTSFFFFVDWALNVLFVQSFVRRTFSVHSLSRAHTTCALHCLTALFHFVWPIYVAALHCTFHISARPTHGGDVVTVGDFCARHHLHSRSALRSLHKRTSLLPLCASRTHCTACAHLAHRFALPRAVEGGLFDRLDVITFNALPTWLLLITVEGVEMIVTLIIW